MYVILFEVCFTFNHEKFAIYVCNLEWCSLGNETMKMQQISMTTFGVEPIRMKWEKWISHLRANLPQSLSCISRWDAAWNYTTLH